MPQVTDKLRDDGLVHQAVGGTDSGFWHQRSSKDLVTFPFDAVGILRVLLATVLLFGWALPTAW